MKTFKVVWEIQLDANDPLDAAKIALKWIQGSSQAHQFYVQEEDSKELFSVDLDEEDHDTVLPVNVYIPLIDLK